MSSKQEVKLNEAVLIELVRIASEQLVISKLNFEEILEEKSARGLPHQSFSNELVVDASCDTFGINHPCRLVFALLSLLHTFTAINNSADAKVVSCSFFFFFVLDFSSFFFRFPFLEGLLSSSSSLFVPICFG
jgi:hypothetical protein